MNWKIYLSGEIHSDWREKIEQSCEALNLPITFYTPITDHGKSDAAGDVLGVEEKSFWRDHKSAKVNSVRIKTYLEQCDLAIIRFGDKYKQWNAAFDAGYCAALGKPYITLHDENIVHALKEVDGAAMAWAETPEQVIELLKHIIGQSK